MTVIYCDLCGKALEKGDAGIAVGIRNLTISVSEFRADSCDACAKKLISDLKVQIAKTKKV